MTREEEIKNMAVQICEKYFPDIVTNNIDTKLLPTINQISNDKRKAVWACMEVAQWADKNLFPNFINVKDRLPELRECVLVFGVLDANIPIFNSDGERIYHTDKISDVWFNKRTEPSEHTDGNGFLLLKFHEKYKITHWFPIPKLDGKELYERI